MKHYPLFAVFLFIACFCGCVADEQVQLKNTFLRQCEQRRSPPMGGARQMAYSDHENLELSCEEIVQKLHKQCFSKSQKESRGMVSIHTYVGCMHNNRFLF